MRYKWSNVKLTLKKRDGIDDDRSKYSGTFEQYLARTYPRSRFNTNTKTIIYEKELKGVIGFANNFPFSAQHLINFLNIESPIMQQIVKNFEEFTNQQKFFPPGFPVYFELPVVPTTKFILRVTDFTWQLPKQASEDPNFFMIPKHARRSFSWNHEP